MTNSHEIFGRQSWLDSTGRWLDTAY